MLSQALKKPLILSLTLLLTILSLSAYNQHHVVINNKTNYDIYIEATEMKYINLLWLCPFNSMPKNKFDGMQPLPKKSFKQGAWECYYPTKIIFKLEGGEFSAPFDLSTTSEIKAPFHLKNGANGVNINVEKTRDLVSSDFPFHQKNIIITDEDNNN